MSYTSKTKSNPIARITPTSKISNILAFTAVNSSAVTPSDTLTYLWTISPSVGVAIATPAAVSTTITVPSGQGEYTVTLTVTSVATGFTAQDTYEFKVDRIIEVMGTDEDHNDYFSTLQAAFNWINTNDVANASSYVIRILGTTADAARIVPNLARVEFGKKGRITVGVDLTVAGNYYWSGIGKQQLQQQMVVSAGTVFTVNAGCGLWLENMYVVHSTALTNAINVISGTFVSYFSYIQHTSTGACIALTTNASGFIFTTDMVSTNDGLTVSNNSQLNNLRECNIIADRNGIVLTDLASTNRISNCDISCTVLGAANNHCLSITNNGTINAPVTLYVDNVRARMAGNVTGTSSTLFIQGDTHRVYVNDCSFYSTSNIAFYRFNTALTNNIFTNCQFVNEAGLNAIISSSNATVTIAAAWAGANIFNSTIRGALVGPVTPAVGTLLSGENIQY